MAKGEEIEPFLSRLQAIWDQLTGMGVKMEDDVMVRTTLNAVTEEWETFVQSHSGREDLPTGTICGRSSDKKKSIGSPRDSSTSGRAK